MEIVVIAGDSMRQQRQVGKTVDRQLRHCNIIINNSGCTYKYADGSVTINERNGMEGNQPGDR